MISELIKKHKIEIWEMIQKSNSGKSLLKQIDAMWKRIEVLLAKELKQMMKGK